MTNKYIDKLKQVFDLPFVKALKQQGAGVYIVGGAVRDALRKKDPKDIDLIISRVPYAQLISFLKQYGDVKTVGEAFGVILFKTEGFEGEIALPRVDSKDKSLKGHKSIVAQSDPYIPISKDLARRDFTINAIALTFNEQGEAEFIDPFNGISDLKVREIRYVDSEAFADDPLRLLRAIQFGARFYFSITQRTLDAIANNAHLIKEITPERILMEFQKVIDKKGNIDSFFGFLDSTQVFKNIFGFKMNFKRSLRFVKDITTVGELLFVCCLGQNIYSPEFCKSVFKIDNDTEKEMKALELIFAEGSDLKKKWNVFTAIKVYPQILTSQFLAYNNVGPEFVSRNYPINQKQLKIDGNRLMNEFGLKGEQIAQAYKNMLNAVFTDKVDYRETENLLKFIK